MLNINNQTSPLLVFIDNCITSGAETLEERGTLPLAFALLLLLFSLTFNLCNIWLVVNEELWSKRCGSALTLFLSALADLLNMSNDMSRSLGLGMFRSASSVRSVWRLVPWYTRGISHCSHLSKSGWLRNVQTEQFHLGPSMSGRSSRGPW